MQGRLILKTLGKIEKNRMPVAKYRNDDILRTIVGVFQKTFDDVRCFPNFADNIFCNVGESLVFVPFATNGLCK